MKRTAMIAAILLGSVAGLAAEEKPAARSLAEVRADVEAAARRYEEAKLSKLSDELAGRKDAGERAVATLRLRAMFFDANVRRFRRKVQQRKDASELKERQVAIAEQGLKLAGKLVEARPDDPDARVLLGEFHALTITGPNGAWIGPRAAEQIEKALELAPSHVLAHLAAGRRYLYTPGAFGGSNATALEHLEKAEKIVNERERKLLTERREKALRGVTDKAEKKRVMRELVTRTRTEVWRMREEILVQLSVVYERLDRKKRAKVALRRALAANPHSEEAKLLLSRLEAAQR